MLKRHDADILVVGAGPAGATVARLLAAANRDVLLTEAQALPRDKACAGGLPYRTLGALGLDIRPVISAPVRSVALDGACTGRQVYEVATQAGGVSACVVDRAAFDHYLVRLATAAGVRLEEQCRCLDVTRVPGGFEVRTAKGCLRCRTLCACDGARSPVGRALGFARNDLGFCLAAWAPPAPGLGEQERTRAVFDMACHRDGYAWSFPRHDGFAVGVGGNAPRAPDLRRRLTAFVERTPCVHAAGLSRLHGGVVPVFRRPRERYANQGAFLVGDAAGLVDPFTGEGIFYAIASAQYAAAAILDGSEALYEEWIRARLVPELSIARHYGRWFRAFPCWLRCLGMAMPPAQRHMRLYVDMLQGNLSYQDVYRAMHQGRPFPAEVERTGPSVES